MSSKTIKSVYKRYTLGPDKVPRPGTESLGELCCAECYFKVLFPAVEVSKVGLPGRHFNIASRFLS